MAHQQEYRAAPAPQKAPHFSDHSAPKSQPRPTLIKITMDDLYVA